MHTAGPPTKRSYPAFQADAAAPAAGLGALVTRGQAELSPVELLVVGSIAGVVAKTVTAPLDRVRLIYQVTPSKVYSLRCAIELARDIARLAGPQGLWYGHMATVYRVVPFAGVQFLMFETIMKRLSKTPEAKELPLAPFWVPACAGASAAVSATIATYPLDVIRTRIAGHLEAVPRYRNYSSAVRGILEIEGFRGLFRGLSPTLLGIGPYGALSFSAFEFSKGKLRQWHGVSSDADVPLHHLLAAGSLSGASAQLLSYPIQTVRRRMQLPYPEELGAQGSLAYANIRETFRQIHTTEGLVALYRGASIVWLKGPLTVGLAFGVNDVLKGILHKRKEIHSSEGVPGLWRGHGATLLRVVPYSATSFTVFEPYKAWLRCAVPDLGDVQAVGTSVLAVFEHPGAVGTSVLAVFEHPGAVATSVLAIFEHPGAVGTSPGAVGTSVLAVFERPVAVGTSVLAVFERPGAARMAAHQGTAAYDGYLRAVSQIVRAEGALALWSGLKPTLLGIVPYSGISFSVFGTLKVYIKQAQARMAAHQGTAAYDGYLRAVSQIVRAEGALALWSGLKPTLLGIVPYSGISFSVFGTLKVYIKQAQGLQSQSDIGTFTRLGAGAFAGLVAQSITYPLDIVRRRSQVHPDQYSHLAVTIPRMTKDYGNYFESYC
ncbi:Mitochondrial substrate carrier family protein P [Symbiodinium microadriaticum]|uniref:Mitochondrial substrate carrier family protein P n=1 Tax=Symbiodinium microadriaticum TaxID=2951 RepID=A0A1Q9ERK2_SYMMI|nr:Mitochondrial substrate carrier family protein P [Symbiodinium microadriaticum]